MKCREIIRSDWYQQRWGSKFAIMRNQDEKTRYDNNQGGWRISTSVGGRGTGEHPDIVVGDDLHKALAVESQKDREAVDEYWRGTISTRGVARSVRKVLVMQRLHQEDIAGKVLKANGGDCIYLHNTETWDHICLPMRAEPDQRAPRTRCNFIDTRKPGELLWPSLFPEHKVQQLERDLGSQRAAGQLQQRPIRRGGGAVRAEWFPIIKRTHQQNMEDAEAAVRFWDFAATQDDGDYTVGNLMILTKDGKIRICHIERGQWSPSQRDNVVERTAKADGQGVAIRWEEEGGSSGKTLTMHYVRLLRGYNATGIRPSGSKEVRFQPFQAWAEHGMIEVVQADWNHEFFDEMESLWSGAHDDQADTCSGGFNYLAASEDFFAAEDTFAACTGGPDDDHKPLSKEEREDLPPWLKEIMDETLGSSQGDWRDMD